MTWNLRLTGRAIVEFVVEKGDGSSFTPQAGGIPIKSAKIQVFRNQNLSMF